MHPSWDLPFAVFVKKISVHVCTWSHACIQVVVLYVRIKVAVAFVMPHCTNAAKSSPPFS